jgi:hypothetical protein
MTIFSDVESEEECPSCAVEFLVNWDSEVISDLPKFCTFCGVELENDEDEDDYIEEEDEFVQDE